MKTTTNPSAHNAETNSSRINYKSSLRSIDEVKNDQLRAVLTGRIQSREKANRRDQAILDGSARDLERCETPGILCARWYKAAVREYLRNVREWLTGSRAKDRHHATIESRLFDRIYRKFRKNGARAVTISEKVLVRKIGSRRSIYRNLNRLRKRGLLDRLERAGSGRGKGREIRRYTLPTFPAWKEFKANFYATYRFD